MIQSIKIKKKKVLAKVSLLEMTKPQLEHATKRCKQELTKSIKTT